MLVLSKLAAAENLKLISLDMHVYVLHTSIYQGLLVRMSEDGLVLIHPLRFFPLEITFSFITFVFECQTT